MKNIFKILVIFFIVAFSFSSVIITTRDLALNKYLDEYLNLKSFSDKNIFMDEDFLTITYTNDDRGVDNEISVFIIEGTTIKSKSKVYLTIGNKEYIDLSLSKQPLYQSKLTGDYFLKDANQKYYDRIFRSFYLAIILKVFFIILIIFIIYLIIKKLKYRL